MFLTAADTQAIKLTVDNQGIVWFLEGEQMPYCSGQSVETFISSWAPPSTSVARVVGSAENVPLILSLYHRFSGHPGQTLEVCSPLCIEGADRHDPEMTLFRMRGYGVSPSAGGWHMFGQLDLPSYLLSYFLHPGCGHRAAVSQEQIIQNLHCHPAWPYLSFIDHLDKEAIARIIALVIDPRWFVDPVDPDRTDKLETFLGLTPKTQASLTDGSWRAERCKLVLSSWNTIQADTQEDVGSPRRFLYRERGFNSGNRGNLKGSRLLIEFLRQSWTAAVCAGPQSHRLFVPEHFFPCIDEVDAFRRFIHARNSKR